MSFALYHSVLRHVSGSALRLVDLTRLLPLSHCRLAQGEAFQPFSFNTSSRDLSVAAIRWRLAESSWFGFLFPFLVPLLHFLASLRGGDSVCYGGFDVHEENDTSHLFIDDPVASLSDMTCSRSMGRRKMAMFA